MSSEFIELNYVRTMEKTHGILVNNVRRMEKTHTIVESPFIVSIYNITCY